MSEGWHGPGSSWGRNYVQAFRLIKVLLVKTSMCNLTFGLYWYNVMGCEYIFHPELLRFITSDVSWKMTYIFREPLYCRRVSASQALPGKDVSPGTQSFPPWLFLYKMSTVKKMFASQSWRASLEDLWWHPTSMCSLRSWLLLGT